MATKGPEAASMDEDRQTITTPCTKCPIRKLQAFREFTPEELALVQKFKVGELMVKAGSRVFLEEHDNAHLFSVLHGWVMRYKVLESGRRQVLNFAVRGDFLGLQSVMFHKMLHSAQALSDVRLCVFSRERVWELYEEHAGLAFDMTWIASREESMLADHISLRWASNQPCSGSRTSCSAFSTARAEPACSRDDGSISP